jgi:hypothetical protein
MAEVEAFDPVRYLDFNISQLKTNSEYVIWQQIDARMTAADQLLALGLFSEAADILRGVIEQEGTTEMQIGYAQKTLQTLISKGLIQAETIESQNVIGDNQP